MMALLVESCHFPRAPASNVHVALRCATPGTPQTRNSYRIAASCIGICLSTQVWCKLRSQRRRKFVRALPKDLEETFAAEPWKRGFEAGEEVKPLCLDVKVLASASTKDLFGTIYRNSAGRLRIGASRYSHWFDGDGFVSALSIDGERQKAAFASRFVRTPRFQVQEEPEALSKTMAGLGIATGGAWTPAANGDVFSNLLRIPTNPANTSVLWWGDRLLALCEGGLPYRLDPGTLETLGEELFKSSTISQQLAALGVLFFSAHPKRDAQSGELFNIGLAISVPPSIQVFRCTSSGELSQRSRVPLEEFTFVHDFAITEKYIVLIMPPWVCPKEGLLQSLWEGGMGKKFRWQEDLGTRCVLLQRSDLKPAAWQHIFEATFRSLEVPLILFGAKVFDATLKPAVSLYHTACASENSTDTILSPSTSQLVVCCLFLFLL